MRSWGEPAVSRHGVIACAYVAVALVLGGGGSPSPAAEVTVQLCFGAAVLAWMWVPLRRGDLVPVPLRLLALGLAILALPVVQLIPLPPAMWQTLPGRELEVRSLALVGAEQTWQPLSISPPATLAALLVMVPAVGAMWGAASLPAKDRRALLAAIAAITVGGAILGTLQVVGGPGAFQFYEKSHRGWLTAFHANRNAAADALLIGSLALSAWFAGRRSRRPVSGEGGALVALLLALLALAVVMTGSRTGMALLVPVMLANLWLMAGRGGMQLSRRAFGIAILVACAVVGLLALIASNPRLAAALARFDAVGDARTALWHDTLTALSAWYPAGSGMGTFVNAFLPFERAAVLDPFFPNRAHNDYLEFMVEAGVLAPLYLLAGAAALGSLAVQGWRAATPPRAVAVFANGTLLVIALHAIVDYPLRNMAIACLAGVAAGLLSAPPDNRRGRREKDGSDERRV